MKNVIYKIVNLVNDKFYVGSTNDSKIRFRQHRKLLRGNRHHCAHLQAAWNKYGESKFDFVIVEQLSEESDLWTAEDIWLLQWVGKPECYNSGRSVDAPMRGRVGALHPSFGVPIDALQKEQISATLKAYYAADYFNHPRVGKTHSEETKAKISKERKGKMAGAEHYRFGQTVSDDVRKKIGDTQRGKPKAPGREITEAGRAKIRAAAEAGHYATFKGKHHTEEAKKLMGAAIVMLPSGKRFDTITEMRAATGMGIALVQRALKTNKEISKGPFAGISFQYQDPEREAARLRRAAELMATKPKVKLGRPAGSVNAVQLQPVRTLPDGHTYPSISEFVRQTGIPRTAAFKMLAGTVRDGLTLERV